MYGGAFSLGQRSCGYPLAFGTCFFRTYTEYEIWDVALFCHPDHTTLSTLIVPACPPTHISSAPYLFCVSGHATTSSLLPLRPLFQTVEKIHPKSPPNPIPSPNFRYLGSIPVPGPRETRGNTASTTTGSSGAGGTVEEHERGPSVVRPWEEPIRTRVGVTPLDVRFPPNKVCCTLYAMRAWLCEFSLLSVPAGPIDSGGDRDNRRTIELGV